jgi:carbamoyltransferase
MAAVLGLRLGPGHDTGAALVYEHSGELRCVAIAEERLSRQKYSRAFPQLAIAACLNEAGITARELDAVVFEKAVWNYGATWYEQVPGSQWQHWTDPLEKDFFASIGRVPSYYINHHLAHAATVWHNTDWPLDGEPGAMLVIDGRGSTWGDGHTGPGGPLHTFERFEDDRGGFHIGDARRLKRIDHRAETQSIFLGRGRTIERVDVSLRSGIGFFYAWLTQAVLGFGHMHAGKSMGLAAYGDPSSPSFPLLPASILQGIDTDLTETLLAEFDGGMAFRQRTLEPPTERYFADAAAWGQREMSRAVLHLARLAVERTGARRLGYAGGVALNVVSNREVRDELLGGGKIDDMFVQPAASDTGLALGAALIGYYNILQRTAPFQKNQVYLGPTASARGCTDFLLDRGGVLPDQLLGRTADLLLEGKIVGWFQGRSENGPRALGARSLLCWPRPQWMKDHLNNKVKHREPFRPFAPIVQVEHASESFDADFPVPYMLFNTKVRPSAREKLPAVTHADGSGRLQTVSKEDAPLLHALLAEIRRRDGVGVLLNTSFNDNGEPIVETVEHAHRCFSATAIDALVCGQALLEKPAASANPSDTAPAHSRAPAVLASR